MGLTTSKDLFEAAKHLIPGGVNSPVRACGSVGGEPVFIEKGMAAGFSMRRESPMLTMSCHGDR